MEQPDEIAAGRSTSCGCGPFAGRRARVWLAVLGAALVVLAALWARGAGGDGGEEGGGGADSRAGRADSCVLFDHEHGDWSAILSRLVRAGIVDYAGLDRTGGPSLAAYLRSLESVCPGHFETWTRGEKLAFWLNAYNAYTVKLVLDHYPIRSIRSIGLLPGAAFRERFIPLGRLRGSSLSLNDMEHEILRRDFGEPRIHFAIVCASRSCPALRSEAYRARDLEAQLDDAARSFVRDRTKNRFDAGTRTLHLSSIFDWFHEDFERAAGSVPALVARYSDDATASAIRAGGVRIEHLDYDWSLNGR